jgi:hypothetical protein
MCSRTEWESFARMVENAVEEGPVRELVRAAADRIDALIEEAMRWRCAPQDADWVWGTGRRSRPEWVV